MSSRLDPLRRSDGGIRTKLATRDSDGAPHPTTSEQYRARLAAGPDLPSVRSRVRAATCQMSAALPVPYGAAGAGALSVLHAITGLSIGGAEWMLYRLLAAGDRDRFAPSVMSLLSPGAVGRRIEAMNVPIVSLGMQERLPSRLPLVRLARVPRAHRPDLLQGWMYHGNLAATLGWWFLEQRCPLVWSIHHSAADITNEKASTRVAMRINGRLSHLTAAIVYCSSQSALQHERLGFDPARTVVIPNGFDCTSSRPERNAKGRLCADLGIDPRRPLVGMLTRVHPMKDHRNLLRAMALLVARSIDVQLILVGRGIDDPWGGIARAVERAGLGNRVVLLGEREDIRPIVAGLDILASPSAWGEAFPLIVGDAMASGVPCVVTDVGDCAWIVGDTGVVVPPRDSTALAAAIERLVGLDPEARRRLGAAARTRIREKFSLASVARQYEELYLSLAARHGRRAVPVEPAVVPDGLQAAADVVNHTVD